jgi:hypothetical protein
LLRSGNAETVKIWLKFGACGCYVLNITDITQPIKIKIAFSEGRSRAPYGSVSHLFLPVISNLNLL